MGNGGHGAGDAGHDNQSHGHQRRQLVALLQAQQGEDFLVDGQIDQNNDRGTHAGTQNQHREEIQAQEPPGALSRQRRGQKPDGAAPGEGRLIQGVGAAEGENQEGNGRIAEGRRHNAAHGQLRHQQKHQQAEHRGPGNTHGDPQQHRAEEDAQQQHGAFGHAVQRREPEEQQHNQTGQNKDGPFAF